MKPSPCLHPITIKGKYGNIQVPCGKCSACLVNQGRQRTTQLDLSLKAFPFQFLVTLTYSDEHLPLARFSDGLLIHDFDCDYQGEIYSLPTSDLDVTSINHLKASIDKFGGLPVLCHRHLINFKKRIRYQLRKIDYHEEIYIYACAEYGPTTLRPHYHLLFGFKSGFRTSVFRECVCKAWSVCHKIGKDFVYGSIGFVDVKRCFGHKSEQYVAQYLNCTSHLPKVLSSARWRPFSSKSSDVDFRLSVLSQRDVKEVFAHPTYEVAYLQHGKCVNLPLPQAYQSRYFPRIPKFNNWTDDELYTIYGLFGFLSKRSIADIDSAFRWFVQSFDLTDYNYLVERNKPFLGFDNSVMPLTVLQMCLQRLVYFDGNGEPIYDVAIQRRNFAKVFYISRRVYKNAEICGVSVREYVNKIIDYFKGYEIYKLRNFYQMQMELLDSAVNPVDLDLILTLYYDTDEDYCDYGYYAHQFELTGVKSVDSIPMQIKYKNLSDNILLNTTKTKKANDHAFSMGKRRKPYIPKVSNKYFNF